MLNKNGGLNVDSLFYTDPEYKAVIEGCFHGEPQAVYTFSHEDVLAVQKFIEENSIGNTKDKTALSRFVEMFLK